MFNYAELKAHWWLFLVSGLISGFMGAALVFWPGKTLTVVGFLIGLWMLLFGIIRFVMAIFGGEADGRWFLVIVGLLGIVLGIVVMKNPSQTVGVVADSFDTLVPSAELAASAFEDANEVFGDTVEVVTVDVPDGLDAVVDALPAIESVAAIIDNTLGFLSFVGVDYNPEVPFDEAVAELEVAIADLPQQLRDQAEPLASLQEDFSSFGTSASDIAVDLAALQTSLDEAQRLFDTYAETTEAATAAVEDIRGDLAWVRWMALLAVILITTALAGLQAVPILLGRRFNNSGGDV